MKKVPLLFLKILILAIGICLSILILDGFYVKNRVAYEYLSFINDKEALAQKAPNHKIALIGGSNFLFGANSDTLEKYLNHTVYNLALIAPLGNRFILNFTKKNIKPNDIIFLSFEYEKKRFADTETHFSMLDFYQETPPIHDNLREKLFGKTLHKINNSRKFLENIFWKDYMKIAKVEDSVSVYFRGAFSEKGDLISQLNNQPRDFDKYNFPIEETDYQVIIEDFNDFIKEVETKKCKVFYIFPPLAQTTYSHGKKTIEAFEKDLRKYLKCQIVGSSTDFVYPDEYFFDSFYHLNSKGLQRRNTDLIRLVKPFLSKEL